MNAKDIVVMNSILPGKLKWIMGIVTRVVIQ